MAWSMLKEGWTGGWGNIYTRTYYETTRSGSSVAVRYRVEYEIKSNYYYGYPIKVYTYSSGALREDITMKNANPSTGSGAIETGWYWQDNGYSTNAIGSCRCNIYSTLGGSAYFDTGWHTVYAPQGAVASTISNSIDFTIANNIPLTISDPTNLGYTYSLFLYVNGVADVVTRSGVTSKSYTFAFTTAEINNIYSKVPNQNSSGVTIYIATYLNGTHIGTTSRGGTCYVSNSNPTLDGFTYLNTSIAVNITGDSKKLLQNKSSIRITAGAVSIKNYAVFSKYTVQIGSRTYESTSNVIDIGTTAGEENITVKVIDSRGNFASSIKTIKLSGGDIVLVPYEDPLIEKYEAGRISNGTSSTVSIVATAKVSQVMKEKSQYTVRARYKELPSGSYGSYTNLTNTITSAGNITINTNAFNLDINKSFVVELAIADYYTTAVWQITVPSAKMLLSLRKGMVGINMIPEAGRGALQVDGGITVNGKSLDAPTGVISTWIYGYATIPSGWINLEGQAISRTTYASLFAIIGTAFGSGDGSTTFNLPDFRGRVVAGYNSSDANFNGIGKKVGASTHTLSLAEITAHNHTATTSWAGDHNHNFRGWRLSNNSGGVQVRSREDIPGDGWDGGNDDTQGGHSHTLTTSSVGSTSAHNNLSPYIAMLWIIKY